MSKNRAAFSFLFVFVIVLDFEHARARPAEPPTKFNLNTSVESIERIGKQSSPTKWEQGTEWFGRFGDALRFGRGKLVNSAMTTRNIIAERAESLASDARNNVASLIAGSDIIAQGSSAINSLVSVGSLNTLFPPKVRETARLENENDQSIFEVKKSNPIGNLLEMYLRPTPLVDKISEHEKYGNSGDKFIGVGRALVGGLEGLSNFFNAVVDFPIDTAKKTSRGFTEALNQLGGRLVGLQ